MKKIPRSIRKYIRTEKARIRQDFLSKAERGEEITRLFAVIKIPVVEEGDQSADLKNESAARKKPAKGRSRHHGE